MCASAIVGFRVLRIFECYNDDPLSDLQSFTQRVPHYYTHPHENHKYQVKDRPQRRSIVSEPIREPQQHHYELDIVFQTQ